MPQRFDWKDGLSSVAACLYTLYLIFVVTEDYVEFYHFEIAVFLFSWVSHRAHIKEAAAFLAKTYVEDLINFTLQKPTAYSLGFGILHIVWVTSHFQLS